MPSTKELNLRVLKSPNADVLQGMNQSIWNLKVPQGVKGTYRFAQLDDGNIHSRDDFPRKPPISLTLRARVSASDIPGTWGFGFWNDPFTLSLGFGGGTRRFPSLPNAVWFFYSSPHNYLSFRNDLPANGIIAQSFCSCKLPTPLLSIGVCGFPILLWPRFARKVRSSIRHLITEESFQLPIDVTQWHHYSLDWCIDGVIFKIDDQTLVSKITPVAPLGFVLWIDNQYVAFPPNGRISYGTLENPNPVWLKVEALQIDS